MAQPVVPVPSTVPVPVPAPMVPTVQAIVELLAAHGDDMRQRARSLLASPQDAEDVVQDVAMSLIEAPHILGQIERLGAWLITLVTRRCIDMIRRNVRRKSTPLDDSTAGLDSASDADNSVEAAQRAELLDAMAEAVDVLPPAWRMVVVENVINGRPFREISEQTGVPMGTLMSNKQKALRALRQHLTSRGFFPESEPASGRSLGLGPSPATAPQPANSTPASAPTFVGGST